MKVFHLVARLSKIQSSTVKSRDMTALLLSHLRRSFPGTFHEVLRELLYAFDCFGSTPLHISAVTGNCLCIELLLRHIIDMNKHPSSMQDDDGYHPTTVACAEIARIVIQFEEIYTGKPLFEIDPKLQSGDIAIYKNDSVDKTQYLQTKAWGVLNCLCSLLKSGYPIESTDYSDNTIFHSLAYCPQGKALEFILQTIISLDTLAPDKERVLEETLEKVNDKGWTCFHVALSLVKSADERSILHKASRDCNAKDNSSLTSAHMLLKHMLKYTSSHFQINFDPFKPIISCGKRDKSGGHRRIPYEDRFALLKNEYNLHGAAKFLLGLAHTPRIVVIAGAGISTSAGIPDFRSRNGLYANSATADLFSIESVYHKTDQFYAAVRDIFLPVIDGEYNPTTTHAFLRLLHDCGWLLRVYTQNIDMLESVVFEGSHATDDMIIECHGSMRRFYCVSCSNYISNAADMEKQVWSLIRERLIPTCIHCGALLRPDVTFFGEPLSAKFHQQILQDIPTCDLLLVMGTSLLVYPVASLPQMVGPETVRMLWNREASGCFQFIAPGNDTSHASEESRVQQCETRGYRDIFHRSDCDSAAFEFASIIGKSEELEEIISKYHI